MATEVTVNRKDISPQNVPLIQIHWCKAMKKIQIRNKHKKNVQSSLSMELVTILSFVQKSEKLMQLLLTAHWIENQYHPEQTRMSMSLFTNDITVPDDFDISRADCMREPVAVVVAHTANMKMLLQHVYCNGALW